MDKARAALSSSLLAAAAAAAAAQDGIEIVEPTEPASAAAEAGGAVSADPASAAALAAGAAGASGASGAAGVAFEDRALTRKEEASLLHPLLRLRQACCHPQVCEIAVKGVSSSSCSVHVYDAVGLLDRGILLCH